MRITLQQLQRIIRESWSEEKQEENPPTRTLGTGYGFSNPEDDADEVDTDVEEKVTEARRGPRDAEPYMCSDCGCEFDAQRSTSDYPECPSCGSPRVAPFRGQHDQENDAFEGHDYVFDRLMEDWGYGEEVPPNARDSEVANDVPECEECGGVYGQHETWCPLAGQDEGGSYDEGGEGEDPWKKDTQNPRDVG